MIRFFRWLRSWWASPDLLSDLWMKQLRQAERVEFHGVSVKGPFGGSR